MASSRTFICRFPFSWVVHAASKNEWKSKRRNSFSVHAELVLLQSMKNEWMFFFFFLLFFFLSLEYGFVLVCIDQFFFGLRIPDIFRRKFPQSRTHCGMQISIACTNFNYYSNSVQKVLHFFAANIMHLIININFLIQWNQTNRSKYVHSARKKYDSEF